MDGSETGNKYTEKLTKPGVDSLERLTRQTNETTQEKCRLLTRQLKEISVSTKILMPLWCIFKMCI